MKACKDYRAEWGNLSEANYQLNAASGLNFQLLKGKAYVEPGTGKIYFESDLL